MLALPLEEWSLKVSDGPPGRRGRGPRPAGLGRRRAGRAPRSASRSPAPDLRGDHPVPDYVSAWPAGGPDVGAPLDTLWQWAIDGRRSHRARARRWTATPTADVCIVGAGYTGLWTAYYLLERDPVPATSLVVEAETAGFGASGRNGGWCSALLPQGVDGIARRHGRDAALAMRRAMLDTVDEVGGVAAAERHRLRLRARAARSCVARNAGPARPGPGRGRARPALGRRRRPALLDAGEAREHVGVDGALGATYTPHCARVQPAKLVRGLAEVVERARRRASPRAPGALELRAGEVRHRPRHASGPGASSGPPRPGRRRCPAAGATSSRCTR